MKKLLFLACIMFLMACKSDVTNRVNAMDGYWNIESVTLADGSERDFPFSNHMDHFEIDGYNGVKNRVSPTYDGSFINYGSPVSFTWKLEHEEVILYFKNGTEAYQQTLKKCDENELILVHENGTEYIYKAYDNAQE